MAVKQYVRFDRQSHVVHRVIHTIGFDLELTVARLREHISMREPQLGEFYGGSAPRATNGRSGGSEEERRCRRNDAWKSRREAIVQPEKSVGIVYYRLGLVAQELRQWEAAVAWYEKTLTASESQHEHQLVAGTCRQLSSVHQAQGHLHEALDWAVRCYVASDSCSEDRNAALRDLACRFLDQEGQTALEEAWRRITGGPLPDYIHFAWDEPLPRCNDLSAERER
jgi:tetratricopeptide (TPR) repeat protein